MPRAAISVNKFHSYNFLKLHKIVQAQERMETTCSIEEWNEMLVFRQAAGKKAEGNKLIAQITEGLHQLFRKPSKFV
jgi:hypothetical protein